MRRFLMVVAVVAVIAGLSISSFAGPTSVCTQTKTTLSLYPGCHQLVQPGQQDCVIAKVYEYYPTGGLGVVNEPGVVYFIDNNTHSVLAVSSLNSYGYAVGCFKLKSDVDVFAYFVGLTAAGTQIMDQVAFLCSSHSQGIDIDVENNLALHGCGPSFELFD